MATVSKSSINVVSGGTFNLTSGTTITPFTLSAGQYAIVTIAQMSVTNAAATAIASVQVGGQIVMQVTAAGSAQTSTLVSNNIGSVVQAANLPTFYVASTFQVAATGSGATISVVGFYTIFQNS